MNKARRKAIGDVIKTLEKMQADWDDACAAVETIRDEEREAYDNMPEGTKSGEKGEAADAAANVLDEVHGTMMEIDIADLIGKLNEAQGEG